MSAHDGLAERSDSAAVSANPVARRSRSKRANPRLRSVLSLDDFEARARRHLPRPIFGYVAGATEAGVSFRANREEFGKLKLIPQMLLGAASRMQGITLFGKAYAHPFGIAPMGLSALAAYDGDVVLAQAAAAANIPAIMSGTSLTRLERVAEESGSKWFQAYLPGDDARVEAMVDRVAAAGYDTLVVTVDAPVAGSRENNVRNGFEVPLRPSIALAWQGVSHPSWLAGTFFKTLVRHGIPHFENMDVERGPPILSSTLERSLGGRQTLSWRHIELIRRKWNGKLVLKGILAAADVRKTMQYGCDGIIVSNHGGRQLDGAISPLAALPALLEVAGDMAVMLDSGVRRGTDVVKALALGAHFVFVGRPFLFAAAVAGKEGVSHGINILGEEIDRSLALLGVESIGNLHKGFIDGG